MRALRGSSLSVSNTWQASDGYGDLAYVDGRGSYALVFSGCRYECG